MRREKFVLSAADMHRLLDLPADVEVVEAYVTVDPKLAVHVVYEGAVTAVAGTPERTIR